jgi:hypothetical protein
MTERAVPFHCPYCGDENLRPHGTTHGAWECRACLRAFGLKYLGMLNVSRGAAAPPEGDPS